MCLFNSSIVYTAVATRGLKIFVGKAQAESNEGIRIQNVTRFYLFAWKKKAWIFDTLQWQVSDAIVERFR